MKIFCILIATILMTGAASAEYYKYVDESGVLHFTDNLLEVPEGQREKIQRFKEIKPEPPAAEQGAGMADTEPPPKKQGAAAPGSEAKPADDATALSQLQELNREKAVLDQEYEYLVQKKQTLREERKKVSGNEAATAYGAKINALNDEINAFEKRRRVYMEKVKAFNASQ